MGENVGKDKKSTGSSQEVQHFSNVNSEKRKPRGENYQINNKYRA